MVKRTRINISLSHDTAERLRQYAFEHHCCISQAVTQWIWAQKVSGEQLRGQMSLDQMNIGRPSRKKQG